MEELGAPATSFATFVFSGVQQYATDTNKVLVVHELMFLNYGFFYESYDSDITWRVAMGCVDP